MQELFSKKLILSFGILAISCSIALAGDIALVRLRPFVEEFNILINALWRDGHTPFGLSDTFVDPSGFDTYWLMPAERLTDDNIIKLHSFVSGGGHLILVLEYRGDLVEAANRIFEYEPWFEELGRPQAYKECVHDAVPDTFILVFSSSSFILNFDPRWERGSGIDTLITAVGWGGIDCYGDPYDADTAVYDSFAVQILAGYFRAGEITVVADMDIFADFPYSGFTDIITLFDNLQFARQLFACNERADSAALEQEDSTFRVHLHGDFTAFNPDSCEWKFRILHVWPPYEFRGHELGARFIAPDILEIDNPPIHNPVYDTVEVCLMFLPDYDGETVLWDFPVCDTFWFDFSNIAETPTPQSFAISAYPNPFNSSVTISLDFGSESPKPLSTIEIFDVNGRRVVEITPPTPLDRGEHGKSPLSKGDLGGLFVWQPDESLGSGVYLIRARFGSAQQPSGQTYTKPVVYVK